MIALYNVCIIFPRIPALGRGAWRGYNQLYPDLLPEAKLVITGFGPEALDFRQRLYIGLSI